jgi:hypothetical protein
MSASDLPADQSPNEAQLKLVGGPLLDRGHAPPDTQHARAAVDPSPHPGHKRHDAHLALAGVGPSADRAIEATTPKRAAPDQQILARGHSSADTHCHGAAGDLRDHSHTPSVSHAGSAVVDPPAEPIEGPDPIAMAVRPADLVLQITADALDDLERVRIATENRVRSLAQVKGMDGTPEAERMAGIVDGIKALEHQAELELKRALRAHPLGAWVRAAKGVGEKQAARLLAAIGDPYIHSVTGEPRMVSQLWAYCGYHVIRSSSPGGGDSGQGGAEVHQSPAGVAPTRARGAKANWNADARMRAFLVAESCVKQLRKPCTKPEGQAWAEHGDGCACGPYRRIYDEGRQRYADAVHEAPCKRCGPAGRPAPAGSPLSDAHRHARALRFVSKAVLKDLWLAGRSAHAAIDTQRTGGGAIPT